MVKDFSAPIQWPEKLKLVWKTEVGSVYSSPVVSKERAWVHMRKGEEETVSANTGELKWRKDFGAPDTSKMFCGTAFSPVVDQGNLIVYVGDDINGGSMFAFDPATGKERWKWTGEGPGYASPIVMA